MNDHFTKLTEHVYLFPDTCNVYLLKDKDRGILIDAGSGRIMNYLEEVGVSGIDWVLHTHHHRDQCWGDHILIEQEAKIAVPEYERYLFEKVEKFWDHKRIYDNYNDRNTFFSMGKNIPVQASLEDYETFTWHNYRVRVLPAKGHTLGSSVLIVETDGQRMAFTGDLMYEGGKLYQLHAMEYSYGDMAGILFTSQSIRNLARKRPDICLPSHGPVIDDPQECIRKLEQRILRLVRLACPEREECLNERLYPISRHLLWGGAITCSNFYVILSNSGKALLIDYGHSFPEHMHVGEDREDEETMRFVAHHLNELFDNYGVREIEAVIPTHVHDDHTCGIPYLQRHHQVKCWTIKQMAPVLATPNRWSSTPCCYNRPIRIDREFSDGEEFTWEDYRFKIYHAPGQTEFHSIVSTSIDHTEVAFTGDNIFPREVATWASNTRQRPIQTQVFRNSFQLSMHRKCENLMREISPDRICPGHGEPFDFDKFKLENHTDYINQKENLFRELTPEPAEQSVDLFWARMLPYQSTAQVGEEKQFVLLLRNNFPEEREFKANLLLPEKWNALDGSGKIRLSPGKSGKITMSARAPAEKIKTSSRQLITAEVLIDEVSQGPVAEAIVNMK